MTVILLGICELLFVATAASLQSVSGQSYSTNTHLKNGDIQGISLQNVGPLSSEDRTVRRHKT